ncbi:hypothetical protein [Sphingomonas sp. NFX23]|uniref:hypothetical protein n=1 Tax=Sphingomonas sp. NFX23 TaxID=2819532 RepID=UPI003CFA13F6
MTEQFPIFGGPFDGRSYQNTAIIYCARGMMASPINEGVRTPRADESDYQYHMIDLADGGRAFIPSANDDLVRAYRETTDEPGDQAADVLLGEIKRRNLAI